MARLVHVTNHALTRHIERFDGPEDREQRRFLIGLEVSAALSEGRYSTKEPRFSADGRKVGMRGRERDRSLRWAWTADQQRLYLLDKKDRADVVVTSILPGESDFNDKVASNGRF